MTAVSAYGSPSPKREHSCSFPELSGGINLWELDYRLRAGESPEMENLMWREGALNCRDGQVWLSRDESLGEGRRAYGRLFHGFIVAHIGSALYAFDPAAENAAAIPLISDVGGTAGSFFLYGSRLYYKTRGSYTWIEYSNGALSAAPVTPYTPVIAVNADPGSGAGDIYQPENRLSGSVSVWYNAVTGVSVYHLPLKDIDSVDSVTVNGETLSDGYTADLSAGTVTFSAAPEVSDPPENNTVRISFTRANADAYESIMDCDRAAVYGGTGALCVVMAGSLRQPNAYFWNGGNIAMDPGYFPMSQYQLAGDADNPVTGFGCQQSYLVVFQRSSLGRSSLGTVELDGRTALDMPYTPINAMTGCDLPETIRLVGNNLVWACRDGGVYMLRDSSSAMENNVERISRKINGEAARPGLLADLRAGEAASLDDGQRYWLCANGHVWAWDYGLSKSSDPSWFYWTGVDAVSLVREGERVWHMDGRGRLTAMARVYADYSGPIRKVFRFSTQYFGSYDRLKNVNSVLIASRSDTNAELRLTYLTDFERREDKTPLRVVNWLLVPRSLAFRSLRGRGFAEVFRRRPMCRRIRHFAMRLENDIAGQDLSVASAQIFFNYQGRQR